MDTNERPFESVAEELVDLIDHRDQIIGQCTRREMRTKNLLHRGVFVAVFSTDGRLLVHQRSQYKDVWPGWWDIAVGGVVASGEDYQTAAIRELAEEVGVHIDRVPELLGTGIFEDESVRVLGHCYRVTSDGPFSFVDQEILQALLVNPSQLRDLLQTERFLPDSQRILGSVLESEWAALFKK